MRSNEDQGTQGVTLADAIERLTKKKRGRGRLDPAASRDAIGVSVAEAVPTATEPGSGVVSPLVEQAYAGATFYSFTSSDGLFVFEFGDQTDYIDDDGNGDTITVKHLDPSAP